MITLATLIKKVSALAGRVTKQTNAVDGLAARQKIMEDELDEVRGGGEMSLGDCFEAMQNRVDAISMTASDIAKHSAWLTSIEKDIKQLKGQPMPERGSDGPIDRVSGLEARVTAAEKRHATLSVLLRETSEELDDRVDELFGMGSRAKERFEELLVRHNALDSSFCARNNDHIVEHRDLDGFYSDRDGNHIQKLAEHGSRLEVIEKQLSLLSQPEKPPPATLTTAGIPDSTHAHYPNSEIIKKLDFMEDEIRWLRNDGNFHEVEFHDIVDTLEGSIKWIRTRLGNEKVPAKINVAGALNRLTEVDQLIEQANTYVYCEDRAPRLRRARASIKWIRMALGGDA